MREGGGERASPAGMRGLGAESTYLQDILYLQVPVLRKKVHCCSPGRRGYDCGRRGAEGGGK